MVFITGASLIVTDLIVNEFTEGLREIGIRFVIAGIVSVILGYIYRYHRLIAFLIRQLKKKDTDQDKFSSWYRP